MANRRKKQVVEYQEVAVTVPAIADQTTLGAATAEMAVGACSIISAEKRFSQTLGTPMLDIEDATVVQEIRAAFLVGLRDLMHRSGHSAPMTLTGDVHFKIQFSEDDLSEQWISCEFDVDSPQTSGWIEKNQ